MTNETHLYAQHTAVQREAQLAAEQIAHGITSLGRANHAQPGLYADAFFGLSIGLERMGKLIVLADHAIQSNGSFPTDEKLKEIGHDIEVLLAKCETIGQRLDPSRAYHDRPREAVHRGIEATLSLFAKKLRYYNLTHLSGTATDLRDPIALWWELVAKPVLEKHYSQKDRLRDEAEAALMSAAFGGVAVVVHTSEEGHPIQDFASFYQRGRATRIVQKYARLYALQIVRWLGAIIFELSHSGAYEYRIGALLGLHEPFGIYCNEDRNLRQRKRWSIYL